MKQHAFNQHLGSMDSYGFYANPITLQGCSEKKRLGEIHHGVNHFDQVKSCVLYFLSNLAINFYSSVRPLHVITYCGTHLFFAASHIISRCLICQVGQCISFTCTSGPSSSASISGEMNTFLSASQTVVMCFRHERYAENPANHIVWKETLVCGKCADKGITILSKYSSWLYLKHLQDEANNFLICWASRRFRTESEPTNVDLGKFI